VLAEGNVYAIRQLIDKQPHRIRIECDRPHAIGSALASAEHIARVAFERNAVLLETRDPDRCYAEVAEAVLASGVAVRQLTSPDNNLGAVFDYLTRAGGGA
jgi:ABC-2 type transport system ATP-binding protein